MSRSKASTSKSGESRILPEPADSKEVKSAPVKNDSSGIKKPVLWKRILIGLSFSFLFLFLFSLVYILSVNSSPQAIFSDIADETYSHASKESVFSFFGSLNAKCSQMDDLAKSFGISSGASDAILKEAISRSGLDQTQQDSFVFFYGLCLQRNSDNGIFFKNMVSYGLTTFLGKDAANPKADFAVLVSGLADKLPGIDAKNINLIKSGLSLVSLLSSIPVLIVGILVCLAVIIALSFNYLAYLLNKFSKSFISIGISLIIPFIIVSYIVSTHPLNTSFVFEKMTNVFSGTSGSIDTASFTAEFTKAVGLILLKTLYPLNVAIFGGIIFGAGLAILIATKILVKKGRLS